MSVFVPFGFVIHISSRVHYIEIYYVRVNYNEIRNIRVLLWHPTPIPHTGNTAYNLSWIPPPHTAIIRIPLECRMIRCLAGFGRHGEAGA